MTKWIFIVSFCNLSRSVNNNSDIRFINDFSFGIQALIKANVDKKDILVYSAEDLSSYVSELIPKSNIRKIEDNKRFSEEKIEDCKQAFIITIGHGTPGGLFINLNNETKQQTLLTSKNIIDFYENNKGLNTLFLVLGHCYAGTFKYLDLSLSNAGNKNICILSSCEFTKSLSSDDCFNEDEIASNHFSGKERVDLKKLGLNVFLYFFFNFLSSSDNNENPTLLDLYCYCAGRTNEYLSLCSLNSVFADIASFLNLKQPSSTISTNTYSSNDQKLLACIEGRALSKKDEIITKIAEKYSIQKEKIKNEIEELCSNLCARMVSPTPYIVNPKLAKDTTLESLFQKT